MAISIQKIMKESLNFTEPDSILWYDSPILNDLLESVGKVLSKEPFINIMASFLKNHVLLRRLHLGKHPLVGFKQASIFAYRLQHADGHSINISQVYSRSNIVTFNPILKSLRLLETSYLCQLVEVIVAFHR